MPAKPSARLKTKNSHLPGRSADAFDGRWNKGTHAPRAINVPKMSPGQARIDAPGRTRASSTHLGRRLLRPAGTSAIRVFWHLRAAHGRGDAKAATRGRAKAADNVAAARTLPWAAPCWHWHAHPGSLLLSCHVAPAPPQRLPTAREHHCLQNRRPKAPRRRPNHCFLSSRSSHSNRCTCVHHNAARDRRRGLSVETGRRERGACDRGQRQDRDAWDLTVGCQAAMPGAARGRHRASIDGQPARGDPGRSGTPVPAICCGPRPAASASSALTDMKLGACIARGLRMHLRAAEGPPPPRWQTGGGGRTAPRLELNGTAAGKCETAYVTTTPPGPQPARAGTACPEATSGTREAFRHCR